MVPYLPISELCRLAGTCGRKIQTMTGSSEHLTETGSGLKETTGEADHHNVLETRSRIRRFVLWTLCAFLLFVACNSGPPKYEPDSVHLGTDGVLYLHSAAKAAVFRFSLAEWRYLPVRPDYSSGPSSRSKWPRS